MICGDQFLQQVHTENVGDFVSFHSFSSQPVKDEKCASFAINYSTVCKRSYSINGNKNNC